jgi:Holliday junction DNA helicase RuvA
VPGIGKKTAERLVVELVEKLPSMVPLESTGKASGTPNTVGGNAQLLLKALVNMGYRPVEAERAVAHLGKRADTDPLSDLLRSALAFLMA